MIERYYIGIDNGSTGSIGIIETVSRWSIFGPTPIRKMQDYTKKKKTISRLDTDLFLDLMTRHNTGNENRANHTAVIERPMINSTRFNASMSAARMLESTITCLEYLRIPYMFVDSKQWQRVMLPRRMSKCTTPQLKKASLDIGLRLFPKHANEIIKQKDADGLLIAEWAQSGFPHSISYESRG